MILKTHRVYVYSFRNATLRQRAVASQLDAHHFNTRCSLRGIRQQLT